MNNLTLLKPELDDQTYGSRFDPILSGVAQGLARLFPPVEAVRSDEGDEDRDESNTTETDRTGNRSRS